MTPREAAAARRRLRRRIARFLRAGAALAMREARLLRDGASVVGGAARQRWSDRRAARHAALDRRNRTPLPSLYERHPEARNHMRREIGLRSIALDEIVGTAVAGPTQRGSDFQPLPAFRSQNWEARWQRINKAADRLEILPPIDVFRYAGRYWVEDGHNRVAAALRHGQVEIDASVTDLRSPTAPMAARAEPLAPMLEGFGELRAAGEGRFSAAAAGHLATGADEAGAGHEHDVADEPSVEPTPAATADTDPADERHRLRGSARAARKRLGRRREPGATEETQVDGADADVGPGVGGAESVMSSDESATLSGGREADTEATGARRKTSSSDAAGNLAP